MIQPARLPHEKSPKSWKYRLTEDTLIDWSETSHRLYVMGGSVDLMSAHRDFRLATIESCRMMLYEDFRFDGTTGSFDFKVMQRGAAGHDAGCEAVDQGVIPASNQPVLDAIMRDIWLADQVYVPKWRRPIYVADVKYVRYPAVRAYQKREHGH